MQEFRDRPDYDHDKMTAGDMPMTKKDAVFEDGMLVTAMDAKWSLRQAVSVGGFPTFHM